MLKSKLLLLLALTTISGCATTGSSNPPIQPEPSPLAVEPEVQVQTRIVDTACSWVKPIYLKPTDVLADESFNQIKDHDKMWLQKCGKK